MNNQTEIKSENDTSQNHSDVSFSYDSTYTDNFPGILKGLNISLAVTSYQSGSLFFIRSDGHTINTHFKTFPRPMGLYADLNRLTLGTFSQVLELKRCDNILKKIKNGDLDKTTNMSRKILEKDPKLMKELIDERKKELEEVKKSDALYLPRASITTGMINIHDIAWGEEGLWVLNSTFSCLSTLSPEYSFIARWKPSFITPHSPRYHEGNIYLCESGTGTIWRYNPDTRKKDILIKLQGYLRGMTFYGPLMFVGLSKVRSCHIKNPLPICMEHEITYSGIWIINLENDTEIGHIRFDGDVDQIYDIAIIPDAAQPELLNTGSFLIRHIFEFEEYS